MSDNTKNNHISVPIWLKTTLTIREAAEYSNIGINKIENLINGPNCDFVLYLVRGDSLSGNNLNSSLKTILKYSENGCCRFLHKKHGKY